MSSPAGRHGVAASEFIRLRLLQGPSARVFIGFWQTFASAAARISCKLKDFLPPSWRGLEINRWQVASVALVVCAHIGFLWIFLSVTPFSSSPSDERELELSIIQPARTPAAQPKLLKPAADLVELPEIEIEEPPTPAALTEISGVVASQILPPRPDPTHANPPVGIPAPLRQLAEKASALLRVLVLANGEIGDAQIAKSSGNPELDRLAIAFVKANWRFQPAAYLGRAVQDWTTVAVAFKTS